MDYPNPEKYPLFCYILSQQSSNAQPEPEPDPILLLRMPHLTHPEVVQSMADGISDTLQTLSFLRSLGGRPSSGTIAAAGAKIAEIETKLADSEEVIREDLERELQVYKAVVKLEEMHMECERKIRVAEERLPEVYGRVVDELGLGDDEDEEGDKEKIRQEVVEILEKEGKGELMERIEISGRRLRILPRGFGRAHGLVVLNLSNNLLKLLPDSIGGLHELEVLDVSTNLLESLPEPIGMLVNLKHLNLSTNNLKTLTHNIAGCTKLGDLNVSYNNLTSLPTNIGHILPNLKTLSFCFNKIRLLPLSLCEIKSLQILDAHFNELRDLPSQIGKLKNLQVLNVSSNFSNLSELPYSICELINLRELDLSNNQIHFLPGEFYKLSSLENLKMDENPVVVPPLEVAGEGASAVRSYMSKRWQDILVEQQKRKMDEVEAHGSRWRAALNTSWLSSAVFGITEGFRGHVGDEKRHRSLSLDQLL